MPSIIFFRNQKKHPNHDVENFLTSEDACSTETPEQGGARRGTGLREAHISSVNPNVVARHPTAYAAWPGIFWHENAL
jgi:hypothetical protein